MVVVISDTRPHTQHVGAGDGGGQGETQGVESQCKGHGGAKPSSGALQDPPALEGGYEHRCGGE